MPNISPTDPSTLTRDEEVGTTKWLRLLIVLGAVLGLVAVCAIVLRLCLDIHHTLLLFALGGLLAYAIDPAVELLCRPKFGRSQKSMPRTLSVIAVFFGLFVCFSGVMWWLGGQTVAQFKALQRDAPDYKRRAIGLAGDFDSKFLEPRNIDFSLQRTIENPPPEINVYAERASKQALPVLAHTASSVGEFAIVVFIALYLLIFSEEMKGKFNRMLSPHLLTYMVPWQVDANRILGGFVRGQLLLALLTGAVAAIGLLAIGVHLWLIIGLFVILASLIPVFGPYIAAIPAVIAALIGPTHMQPVAGGIAVAILFVVINEAGSKIFYPKLVGKALNLHEVVVLFVLFAGLEIGGIVGTLFAAPVAALAVVTVVHLYRLWQRLPEESLAESADRKDEKKHRLNLLKSSSTPSPSA
jgi:predicted PurR-regulated permease PerM